MAQRVQTTQEIIDGLLAKFQSRLNQDAPLLEKAFLRVISAAVGMTFTSLVKFGFERARQSLALSATGEDLEKIGRNYGVYRRPGKPTEVFVTVTGAPGSVVPITTPFVGAQTGILYYPVETYTLVGSSAQVRLFCEVVGEAGNAAPGDTFLLAHAVAGVQGEALFSSAAEVGIEREDQEVYRRRVLNELRTVGGGGNSADYRRWAEQVLGVLEVYPYSGHPLAGYNGATPAFGPQTPAWNSPGARSLFVLADPVAYPSGMNSSLALQIRQQINYEVESGDAQPPLGHTDSTLWVMPVVETTFHVAIHWLNDNDDPAKDMTAVQALISEALGKFFLGLRPFITGLDSTLDRNNVITASLLARAVQPVLSANNAYCHRLALRDTGGNELNEYKLGQGEVARFGALIPL